MLQSIDNTGTWINIVTHNTNGWLGSKITVMSHDVKDTVDSAPFDCGTGCYGRDGEHREYDNQVAYDDHQNSLPVARLKEGEGKTVEVIIGEHRYRVHLEKFRGGRRTLNNYNIFQGEARMISWGRRGGEPTAPPPPQNEVLLTSHH